MTRRISLLVAGVLCWCLAGSATAAVRYEATTTVMAQGSEVSRSDTEAWIDGDRARVEFTESTNPLIPSGSYLITEDGGGTVFLVNPQQKTYARFDMEQLLAGFGAMMEAMGGMVNIDVSDLAVEKQLEEPGGDLHGYPVTHYRFHTRYTMTMKIMGMSRPNTVEQTQEIWTTQDADFDGFSVWTRQAPRTGFDEIDELIEAEMSKVQGAALRMETTSVTTGKGGRQSTSQASMRVTDVERGVTLEASRTRVPEGYSEAPLAVAPPAGGEGDASGNPFRRILGGGR